MNASKIAVFPDTNLFLHYRSLNEIDWCSLLHSSTVEIEIAPVVARELEKQKTLNPSKKLRDRAATALKLLHKHLANPQVRDGVTLQFLIKEPTPEFAAFRGLNLQLEDDRLIGTFFLYRDENPDTRCVLVTGDLPLTIKAHQFQIEFLALDESLLLPTEPDPLEKKNKELAAELNRYKSREPGTGEAVLDEVRTMISAGFAVLVPSGTNHNIINTGTVPMKLYTIYAPPHHRDGVLQHTRAAAEADNEHFDGKTTE